MNINGGSLSRGLRLTVPGVSPAGLINMSAADEQRMSALARILQDRRGLQRRADGVLMYMYSRQRLERGHPRTSMAANVPLLRTCHLERRNHCHRRRDDRRPTGNSVVTANTTINVNTFDWDGGTIAAAGPRAFHQRLA